MTVIATRLTNQGVYYVNGSFDEVTKSNISITANTVYAAELNEIDFNPITNGVAKKEFPNGNLCVANYFDEFTGAPIVDSSLKMWIDFGQSISYPGTGSTVYDISAQTSSNVNLFGSPTFNSLEYGGTLTFNGTNQYGIGTGTPLGLSAYTKSFWVKLNSYSTNNNTVSSNNGGHFCYFATTNKLYSGHSDWGNYLVFPSTTSFSLNVWYHVALTFDTSAGMILYVNGVQDSSYNGTLTPVPGTGQVDLACFDAGYNLLTGALAQVMIYDRVLSANEISQNFNALRRRFNI